MPYPPPPLGPLGGRHFQDFRRITGPPGQRYVFADIEKHSVDVAQKMKLRGLLVFLHDLDTFARAKLLSKSTRGGVIHAHHYVPYDIPAF